FPASPQAAETQKYQTELQRQEQERWISQAAVPRFKVLGKRHTIPATYLAGATAAAHSGARAVQDLLGSPFPTTKSGSSALDRQWESTASSRRSQTTGPSITSHGERNGAI